jgi:hypothetical protein
MAQILSLIIIWKKLLIHNSSAFALRVIHVLDCLGVLIPNHEMCYVPAHLGI